MKHVDLKRLAGAGAALLLTAAGAAALPPAPHHTLFGTIRDNLGHPLAGGEVAVLTAAGLVDRAPVTLGGVPGQNYQLHLPMDAGATGTPYRPTAMLPLMPFTMRVTLNGATYLPTRFQGGATVNLGEPGGRTRLDLFLGLDSDGDGLPDDWERDVLDSDPADGLRTLADVRPGDDADGDGLSNLAEYVAGTYAFERADGLALEIVEVNPYRVRLRFLSITGRTYRVRTQGPEGWAETPFALAEGGNEGTVWTAAAVGYRDVYVARAPGAAHGVYQLSVQ